MDRDQQSEACSCTTSRRNPLHGGVSNSFNFELSRLQLPSQMESVRWQCLPTQPPIEPRIVCLTLSCKRGLSKSAVKNRVVGFVRTGCCMIVRQQPFTHSSAQKQPYQIQQKRQPDRAEVVRCPVTVDAFLRMASAQLQRGRPMPRVP